MHSLKGLDICKMYYETYGKPMPMNKIGYVPARSHRIVVFPPPLILDSLVRLQRQSILES